MFTRCRVVSGNISVLYLSSSVSYLYDRSRATFIFKKTSSILFVPVTRKTCFTDLYLDRACSVIASTSPLHHRTDSVSLLLCF